MNNITGADKCGIIPQEIQCPTQVINSTNTNCGCCTFRRSFTVKHGLIDTTVNVTKPEYSLLEKMFCCYLLNNYLGIAVEYNSCSGCDCTYCGSCGSCGSCDYDCNFYNN